MTATCRLLAFLILTGLFYAGCERHSLEQTKVLYQHGHGDDHHHDEEGDHGHDKKPHHDDHDGHDDHKGEDHGKGSAEKGGDEQASKGPVKEEPRSLGL